MSVFKNLQTGLDLVATKSPKLLRRGFQAAFIYGGSVLGEKLLDIAHEKYPDNQFIGKADFLAHTAVKTENFFLYGAETAAEFAYYAIPSSNMPNAAKPNKIDHKDATRSEQMNGPLEPANSVDAYADKESPRDAAFLPPKSERNRANLNADLTTPPLSGTSSTIDEEMPEQNSGETENEISSGPPQPNFPRSTIQRPLAPRF